MEEKQAGAKRILVVDDDPVLRKMYATHLEREGFVVSQAEDGEPALKEALSAKPDLIVLDVMMPRMSGFVLLKHLRADSAWGVSVPVIFLTNVNADDEAALYMITSTSPAFYLVKAETTPQKLVAKVREVLQK